MLFLRFCEVSLIKFLYFLDLLLESRHVIVDNVLPELVVLVDYLFNFGALHQFLLTNRLMQLLLVGHRMLLVQGNVRLRLGQVVGVPVVIVVAAAMLALAPVVVLVVRVMLLVVRFLGVRVVIVVAVTVFGLTMVLVMLLAFTLALMRVDVLFMVLRILFLMRFVFMLLRDLLVVQALVRYRKGWLYLVN